MKIFDRQFAHAKSAGSPYQDTILPFEWERDWQLIDSNEPIFFTESEYYTGVKINHPNKVMWVLESPCMVDAGAKNLIQSCHKEFKYILTHDDDLAQLPNAIVFPVGGCWIKPQDAEVYEKIPLSVSNIASNKRFTNGQAMRHEVAKYAPKLKMFGPSYKPIDYKLDALKDFQFHVCIENVKNEHYFTEKVIDCFATGTIPIYWGSKNISSIFNTNGIIEVDDIDEIFYVLDHLKEFKIDHEAIQENFEISRKYWLPESRILDIFRPGV